VRLESVHLELTVFINRCRVCRVSRLSISCQDVQTAYKNWSIIALLKYDESKFILSVDMIGTLKTEVYSILRSFSDPHNINLHENAKKKSVESFIEL